MNLAIREHVSSQNKTIHDGKKKRRRRRRRREQEREREIRLRDGSIIRKDVAAEGRYRER